MNQRTVELGDNTYRTAKSFSTDEFRISNAYGMIGRNGQKFKFAEFNTETSISSLRFSEVSFNDFSVNVCENGLFFPADMNLSEVVKEVFVDCEEEYGDSCVSTYFSYQSMLNWGKGFFLAMGDPIRPKKALSRKSFVFPKNFLLEIVGFDSFLEHYSLIKVSEKNPVYLLVRVDGDGDIHKLKPFNRRK